jgi:hypothetical protein
VVAVAVVVVVAMAVGVWVAVGVAVMAVVRLNTLEVIFNHFVRGFFRVFLPSL